MQAIVVSRDTNAATMRKVSTGPIIFKGWDAWNRCWYYIRHDHAVAVYEDQDGNRWGTLEWPDGTSSNLWRLDHDGYLRDGAEVAVRL